MEGSQEQIECPDCYGIKLAQKNTILLQGAEYGRINYVECGLDHGGDINVTNNEGFTSLHLAAWHDHTEIVQLLLKNGADVHKRDKIAQFTPLIIAAWHGNIEIVQLLLNAGSDVNAMTKEKQSSMHFAALYGHLHVVRLLLDYGAQFNIKDDFGETALESAASSGHFDIVKLLENAV